MARSIRGRLEARAWILGTVDKHIVPAVWLTGQVILCCTLFMEGSGDFTCKFVYIFLTVKLLLHYIYFNDFVYIFGMHSGAR